jgi:uncharacterized protein (TIGR00375 family)
MKFIADLHVHSKYSRATSKNATLEGFYQWANIKGMQVVGTGDFTHPGWFRELREKLIPAEPGLFRLKKKPRTPGLPGLTSGGSEVRFCLSAEISTIYKKAGRARKIHSLIYAPDFDSVARTNKELAKIGNIASDGRPILGLDARNLLELVLDVSDKNHFIPAHIWTPWFSLFGSKSGFDRIEECFDDLSPHIFALETGLSSDPEMNWRLSMLDRYSLVSNSDAHSPCNLGREATVFDTELNYSSLFGALKTKKGFLGTLEFFPEEGKYHLDGHRNCKICLKPEETKKLKERCPVCGKKVTVGVLNRVESLADRKQGKRPSDAPGFTCLIPLPEIISELLGVGKSSKQVLKHYTEIISAFGNEFAVLQDVPIEALKSCSLPLFAEAVSRLRKKRICPSGGYDGEFGVVRVFDSRELSKLRKKSDN